ncbi:2-phospho-L-lactate guanylyltransferase [Dactylosporangium sp. CA-092794]|uniref:2-phospho-L-lactate guanylyltransferase n=1 Tax=Dactylosporangium sp. CA-092794 TaxID=3239929 RepID=UPI003D93B4FC
MHCHGQSTTQPPAPQRSATWVAVVPVKPLRAAKTRLRGAVPEAVHPDLVLAMARDTVAAALACRAVARVVVVCDDPAVCAELTALGAVCLPDAPAAGLNAALSYGAQAAQHAVGERSTFNGHPADSPPRADARSDRADTAASSANDPQAHRPEAARADARPDHGAQRPGTERVGVVALTADLPAMRPCDLESALVAAARTGRRAFVPDLEGTGTVLLAAPAGEPLAPHFGPGSAAAHLRSGAVRLDGAWPSLRRDVDTAADLDAAARLGLGTHTGQVLCAVA